MKLVMDEKLKHRLVGLTVIISLGALFAPAIMKKSNQKLEGSFSVNINLPSKPNAPDVAVTDEKELFKTIKVARVDIPSVSGEKQLPQLVQAESLSNNIKSTNSIKEKSGSLQGASNKAAIASVNQAVKVAPVVAQAKAKIIGQVSVNKAANAAKKPTAKQSIYTVQLASFADLRHAQTLVTRLQSKGYTASYRIASGKNGSIYKVCVGRSSNREEVLKLKDQLASTMKLDGFVVAAAGVS